MLLWIIVYNFVTIYGIATKFGIRMCPYPAFWWTKFQGNRITPLCFMITFTPWRKEKQPIFEVIWEILGVFCSWNLKYEVMTLASISTAKIIWFCKSFTEILICENRIIVLPVNNSQVWCTGFLGHTTHYHMSWLHVKGCKVKSLAQKKA